MHLTRIIFLTVLGVVGGAAATLSPVSYSTPNGGGYPGYDDETYSSANCPNCPTYLSGGLGQLADGVTTPSFFNDENGDYTKMVGWTFSPEIYFYFDSPQTIGQVQIHLSNGHGRAGIALPSSVDILIGGTTLTFTPVEQNAGGSANEWQTFDTQGLVADTVKVTLHRSQSWLFADEFAFSSDVMTAEAPEPSSLLLGGTALLLAGFVRRRRC